MLACLQQVLGEEARLGHQLAGAGGLLADTGDIADTELDRSAALMNNRALLNNKDDPLTQDLNLQQRGEREVPEVGDQCGLQQVAVPGPRPRQWRDHCQWRGQWRGQWRQWADHC